MVDTASLKQRQLVCALVCTLLPPFSEGAAKRKRFTKMSGKRKHKQFVCVFPFWDEAAPAAKAGKVRWLLRGVKIDQNRIVLKSKMFFIYDYIIFYIVFVYTLDNDIHKIINFVGVSALWCVHDA